MNKPYELTAKEWAELAAMKAVLEAWGIEDEEDPAAWLPDWAYGVRFDYQTDGPGYLGPLYLLQGAGSPETSPMAFVRNGEGRLEVVETY